MSISNRKRSFDRHIRRDNQAFLKDGAEGCADPIRIGFVLLQNFSMMSFTGAVDALVTANLLGRSLYSFRTLGLDSDTVHSDLGIDISVNGPLAPHKLVDLDMLFVCGGYRSPLQPDERLLGTLRDAKHRGIALGGLWNGSLILAQAGLMDDYACTVHPENRASLEQICPTARLSSQPFVIDRNRVSCAGANSALDMMLAVVRQHYGQEVVRGVEEILSCDKIREPSDHHQMPTIANDPTLPEPLQTVLRLMESNIEDPLGMEEISSLVNLSRRQIERLFIRFIESTPAKYYLELRITRARRLLFHTNMSVTAVAVACGFVSTTHFSHCYNEYFGISPTQARQSRSKDE